MTPALTCAFGWPWEMHFSGPLFDCPYCAAYVPAPPKAKKAKR